MDFLTTKLRLFRNYLYNRKSGLEANNEPREITKFEGYFEVVFKILSWHDTALTLTYFLISNFIFWLVIQLELKAFGIFFLIILTMFLADTCFENQNQRITMETSHLDMLDELKNDLSDIYLTLKAVRKDSPSSFCIGMSLVFLMISFIARNISGQVICYLLLLALFFGPLIFSKIPPQYIGCVKQFIKSVGSERGVLAEDELIPYIFDKDFNQRDPDLDSLLTDRTADSITNSLISGLNAMPSYLDAEDKESIEEDDLIPQKIGLSLNVDSSDSDSEHKGIRFESKHFNGDSSSEEEIYARSLNFSNVDNIDSKLIDMGGAITENLVKVGNFIRMTVSNPLVRKDSSSDSEFEIINTDEAQE